MLSWLRRRFRQERQEKDESDRFRQAETIESDRFRVQKIARLLGALSFYAEAENYATDSLLQQSSLVSRDRGRRARWALEMVRNSD